MIRVLSPAMMRAVDAAARDRLGAETPMRVAGRLLAERIRAAAPAGRIVAFAGPGDNGGDAFAALAELEPDRERIVYALPARSPSPGRLDAEERAWQAGVSVRPLPADDRSADAALEGAALALDGLLGTGARLPVGEEMAPAVRALARRWKIVLAIDSPTGIDGESGAVVEPAVHARETLTLGALKPGLLLDPARTCVGDLWFGDLGFPADLFPERTPVGALDDDAFLRLLPRRPATADKRSAGALVIVAGSRQFPGAAVLCARAALRAGAGYVTLAAPESTAAVLRTQLVEPVVVELSDHAHPEHITETILDLTRRAAALAIGPGLGLDERWGVIVREVLRTAPVPCVADAGALFHLSKHLASVQGRPLVITPHAGEFARLSGEGTIALGDRVRRLRSFVERTGIVTLLKGRDTLVFDGETLHVNLTGCAALATAGSGDVLTGMIGALLAQGLSPSDAARVAAHWHGRAGEVCAHRRPIGTIAGDLPDALGEALGASVAAARNADAPLRLVFRGDHAATLKNGCG